MKFATSIYVIKSNIYRILKKTNNYLLNILIRYRKVSIIIPAYNSALTISRCLNSVVGQTHKNLDILVVNDGSTDETEAIVRNYIKNDARIRIINQKNLGAGAARNLGIKKAYGKVIVFSDADDYMPSSSIEDLNFTQYIYKSDLVVGSRYTELFGKLEKNIKTVFYENKYNVDARNAREIFNIIAVTSKIHNKDFLIKNNIFFPEGMTSEDFVFTYNEYILAKNICVIKNHVYTYTWGGKVNQSITENRNSKSNLLSRFKQIEMTLSIAETPLGKKMLPYSRPIAIEFGVRLMRHIEAACYEVEAKKIESLDAIMLFCESYKRAILRDLPIQKRCMYIALFDRDYISLEQIVKKKRGEIFDEEIVSKFIEKIKK